ncbi:MAG TPA: Uma2 family endonuclease [Isosphaeraceae bacterium]|nr:Uma2 family endonuclease [Isosphaeraceae bacterium]
MSTSSAISPETPSRRNEVPGESRVRFRASWNTYEILSRELEEQHVLMAYDGESIELMSPGINHERFKSRILFVVVILADHFDLPSVSCRSMTWKNREAERALEADEAFYLTREKVERAATLKKDEAPPYPDLAVEIDLSRSLVDRASIYAALEVPEVWRLDQNSFVIESLDEQGRYHPVGSSRFLRISSQDLDHSILGQPLASDRDFRVEFAAWVRGQFVEQA